MLLLMAVVVTGCSPSETKKMVRLGGTSAVSASIDPTKDWDGWYTVRYGVGETLFKLDKASAPVSWLASKGERVDEQTWKITLKDKVVFSNGQAVTPEKVIASLQRAGEKNVRAKILKESTYSVDGNSVLIHTPVPYPTLLNDLTDPYTAIIDVAGTTDFEKSPVGTGPFVVTSFEANKKAVLARNEKYWDGPVQTEHAEYVNIADFNTLALAVQNGELDIALAMSPASAEAAAKSDKLNIVKTVQPRVYILYFHMDRMTDKAVREAVLYGIDKNTIGNVQLKGVVTPSNSLFLADSEYGAPHLQVREFNVERAKQVLAEVGYQDTNQDGIVEKDGKPLVLRLSIYKRLAMENIATEMQAELKKVGIQVDIENHERASYEVPGDFDMALYSMVTTPTGDPYSTLYDVMGTDRASNFGHYSNAKVDADLKAMEDSTNQEERIRLAEEIQQLAFDDAAYGVIGFHTMETAISKAISGYEIWPNDYYQMTKSVVKR